MIEVEDRTVSEMAITVGMVPEDLSPHNLSRIGEQFALSAMGRGPDHPSREAFARAGMTVGMIVRSLRDGRHSLDCVIALIAGGMDPRFDDSTPQRREIIDSYKSPDD